MARATTPTPSPAPAAPSTPSASTTTNPTTPGATMRVQHQTPIPSTPGSAHRHILSSSIPRTPGTSSLTACSAEPGAFTTVRVHTAKCSECDMRNKDTMLRCPGCTFQVCRPCQERREKEERSLAHGNMLSPAAGTPRVVTPGGVVRRRPTGIAPTPTRVKRVEKGKERGEQEEETKSIGKERGAVEEKSNVEGSTSRKRVLRPESQPKKREATPSDDSSDDDFAPDPTSPTANKRRRTELTSNTDNDRDASFQLLNPTDDPWASAKLNSGNGLFAEKSPSDMTTDELLAHHGVNTSTNPYKAHLMSRHELVISNPVIQIPEVVKRGFKPRPTAEEIQKKIVDKVRQKMGLTPSVAKTDGDESAYSEGEAGEIGLCEGGKGARQVVYPGSGS